MSKHTPGPWTIGPQGDTVIADTGTYVYEPIAECRTTRYVTEEVRKANAALVAAAPELLDTLMRLVDLDERGQNRTLFRTLAIDARAVIAKAEGREVA